MGDLQERKKIPNGVRCEVDMSSHRDGKIPAEPQKKLKKGRLQGKSYSKKRGLLAGYKVSQSGSSPSATAQLLRTRLFARVKVAVSGSPKKGRKVLGMGGR